MDVTPLIKSGSRIIQGYSKGMFRVSGEAYESAIAVFPDRVEEWAFRGDPEALEPADFEHILKQADDLDVVLFGGGERMPFINKVVRDAFTERGLTIEGMDSGAACRTYNVLLAEDRRVVALLLPV